MRKTKTIDNIALRALLCILLFVLCLVAFIPSVTAQAENVTLSGVLSDLKKDPTFDVVKYPARDGDYSLNVIQLAETMSNTLVVYVYQPTAKTKDYKACSMRFTTSSNESADFHDYKLKYISSSGVFYKYVVEKFTVSSEAKREYGIVCLHRKFINGVDKVAENGDVITEIPVAVNQLWTFTTTDGVTSCTYDYYKTISVTAKYCGIVRYYNGTSWATHDYTDSHFIAFNTDEPIIDLLSATVSFSSIERLMREDTKYDEVVYEDVAPEAKKEDHKVTVHRDDEVSNTPISDKYWWSAEAKEYTWKRIQTVDEFKVSEDISRINQERLTGCKWVLRFYESRFIEGSGGPFIKQTIYTKVYDETILSLTHKYLGKVYNVGVVDDKRTEDSDPIKVHKPDSWPWWVWLIIIIVGILLIPVLIVNFPAIVIALIKLVKLIFKALLWLICLPFRAIAALVRKIKGDGGG